ncbi:MAG: hypothetical protein PARBB_03970 [Parabacteroides distasonis]
MHIYDFITTLSYKQIYTPQIFQASTRSFFMRRINRYSLIQTPKKHIAFSRLKYGTKRNLIPFHQLIRKSRNNSLNSATC